MKFIIIIIPIIIIKIIIKNNHTITTIIKKQMGTKRLKRQPKNLKRRAKIKIISGRSCLYRIMRKNILILSKDSVIVRMTSGKSKGSPSISRITK